MIPNLDLLLQLCMFVHLYDHVTHNNVVLVNDLVVAKKGSIDILKMKFYPKKKLYTN